MHQTAQQLLRVITWFSLQSRPLSFSYLILFSYAPVRTIILRRLSLLGTNEFLHRQVVWCACYKNGTARALFILIDVEQNDVRCEQNYFTYATRDVGFSEMLYMVQLLKSSLQKNQRRQLYNSGDRKARTRTG